MTHSRQHAGWATQARRRNETLVACNSCGQPVHPRTHFQAEPPEQWSAPKMAVVVVVAIVFIVAIAILSAAGGA